MDDEDYKVSSELYGEFNYETKLTPQLDANNTVSRFSYNELPHSPKKDMDGDLEVARRKPNTFTNTIEIEHSKSTLLNLVGLQIWRGALLLADWLIYNGKSIPGDNILEVASGVGLTSIVASFFKPVICTDIDVGGLLNLIKSNIDRNDKIIKNPIKVMELDFMTDLSPEIKNILPQVEIILAADVIYDDRLTDAFVESVKRLLSPPPKRTIYIALEKRYVFTVADFDTCAPCYEYFKDGLRDNLAEFKVEELTIDFPQFFNYDRVKELVLWKVTNKY